MSEPRSIPRRLLDLALPVIGIIRVRSLVKFEPVAVAFYPVGALVIVAAALHAALVFGTRGTVEWRGRVYTRAELKQSA